MATDPATQAPTQERGNVPATPTSVHPAPMPDPVDAPTRANTTTTTADASACHVFPPSRAYLAAAPLVTRAVEDRQFPTGIDEEGFTLEVSPESRHVRASEW